MKTEIEISEGDDGFTVMEWSSNRDSGQLIGCFSGRDQAVFFARGYATAKDLEVVTADVLPLNDGGAHG